MVLKPSSMVLYRRAVLKVIEMVFVGNSVIWEWSRKKNNSEISWLTGNWE
jgi:hypothetical protein